MKKMIFGVVVATLLYMPTGGFSMNPEEAREECEARNGGVDRRRVHVPVWWEWDATRQVCIERRY